MTTVSFSHEGASLEAHGSDSEPRSDFVGHLAGVSKHPKRVAAALAAISVFSLAAGVGGLLLKNKQGPSLVYPPSRNTPKVPHVAHAPPAGDAVGFLEPLPHPSQGAVDSALVDAAAATEKGRQAVARLVEDLHFCSDEWKTAPRRLKEGDGCWERVKRLDPCQAVAISVAVASVIVITVIVGVLSPYVTKTNLVPAVWIGMPLLGFVCAMVFCMMSDSECITPPDPIKPVTTI
eukprot:GHVT01025199.1.p1 GENE.GHVT01025199.1~~GHVT01025199.1.p1  ORF type:complete len:234 (+),score=34.12 GHVT01025199.1:80-781(+)